VFFVLFLCNELGWGGCFDFYSFDDVGRFFLVLNSNLFFFFLFVYRALVFEISVGINPFLLCAVCCVLCGCVSELCVCTCI